MPTLNKPITVMWMINLETIRYVTITSRHDEDCNHNQKYAKCPNNFREG